VIQLIDWDGDGDRDLIMDNVNARYYENVGDESGKPRFVDRGDLVDDRLANHNTGPWAADFDNDGHLDLLVGTESGHIYYYHRSYIEGEVPQPQLVADQRRR
jgi:hypothetical protein